MNRLVACLALCLALAGCATPYDPIPDIHDVTSPAQVKVDVTDCAAYAAEYKRPLSIAGIATSGGQGAAGSLGAGAKGGTFSPLGPLLGGVGGILTALLSWVGAIDIDRPRADQQCVRQRLDRDHAGILVEAPF